MTTKQIIGMITVFVLIIAMIVANVIRINIQKKDYNKGNCPICGAKLRLRDYNKNGMRQYICDAGRYSCWISWNFIDKNY